MVRLSEHEARLNALACTKVWKVADVKATMSASASASGYMLKFLVTVFTVCIRTDKLEQTV